MDVPLYDVYLTGKLADDVTPALAAQRLAALFKSTPEAMSALITGKTQLLKRGVDKNTALKYRDTLQKAGCEVAFKAQAIAPTDTATTGDTSTAAHTSTAARTSTETAGANPAPANTTQPASTRPAFANTAPTPPNPAPVATSGLNLAPMEGDLLRPDERTHVTAAVIETAHLSVAPVGPLPTLDTAPVAAPDTSHLSLAAADGNLVDDSEREMIPAIAPDISGLSVAEVGAPIETLKATQEELHPDISGLTLTPAGSDLLTAAERNHQQPAAPKTDHITLAP